MQENRFLVSIVVITYNSSSFIEETLESCLAQTYKNIELVISDDNSTDNTVEICERWLDRFGKVFTSVKLVKSSVNTGLASNFNRGVQAASGKYFKPLAGDDILLNQCVENHVNWIALQDEDIPAFATSEIPFYVENGIRVLKENKVRKRALFFLDGITPEIQFMMALRNIEQPSMSGLFIKREVFMKLGGCDENFPMLEDRPFVMKFLKAGYKFYGNNEPQALHRIHINSIHMSGRDEHIVTRWMMESYIPVRKTYFLPHSTLLEKWAYAYQFLIMKIFYNHAINKKQGIGFRVYNILMLPFEYFRATLHKIVVWHVNRSIARNV